MSETRPPRAIVFHVPQVEDGLLQHAVMLDVTSSRQGPFSPEVIVPGITVHPRVYFTGPSRLSQPIYCYSPRQAPVLISNGIQLLPCTASRPQNQKIEINKMTPLRVDNKVQLLLPKVSAKTDCTLKGGLHHFDGHLHARTKKNGKTDTLKHKPNSGVNNSNGFFGHAMPVTEVNCIPRAGKCDASVIDRKDQRNPAFRCHFLSNISENDVLLGRGAQVEYSGNKKFQALIRHYHMDYLKARKGEKALIVKLIVELVRRQSPSGRFMKQKSIGGEWVEVDTQEALNKTSQALRDCNQKCISKARREKGHEAWLHH